MFIFISKCIVRAITKLRQTCRGIAMLSLSGLLCFVAFSASAEEISEYRLKVAFLYNFIAYTQWPHPVNETLTVCIHGEDPFGDNLHYLQQKKINDADILIRFTQNIAELSACQVVFIAKSAINNLDEILNQIGSQPILTVTDIPDGIRHGTVINMTIKEGKVVFAADINAAQEKKLLLNSQLLRFANKVYR